jgi:hypothetical protein
VKRSSRQALVGLGALAVILVVIAVLAAHGNGVVGLRVDVLSARRTEPGTIETFTISVRDTEGRVQSVHVDFGDGQATDVPVDPQGCVKPLSTKFDVEHAFDFTGFSTVTARVATGGCGGKRESVEAIRTIEVRKVRR